MTKTKKKVISKPKMPTKSTFKKETNQAVKEMSVIGKKIAGKCKQVKKKFNALEPETKKKILAGVIGAVAIVAGIGASAAIKANKKK